MTLVKICGVTRPEDAAVAVEAGADMIGVIFWAASPRSASEQQAARACARPCPSGVRARRRVRRRGPERMDELVEELGLDRVQLHGAEPRALVERYGARAIRGVRDGDLSRRAARRAGHLRPALGRDARHRGAVRALARRQRARRRLARCCWRARSTPTTSRRPCARCGPTASTCASGVESSAGVKDHERVRRFVAAAKEAG